MHATFLMQTAGRIYSCDRNITRQLVSIQTKSTLSRRYFRPKYLPPPRAVSNIARAHLITRNITRANSGNCEPDGEGFGFEFSVPLSTGNYIAVNYFEFNLCYCLLC